MSGFDMERFRGAALAPRQAPVPVPDLAHWFADGIDPVWTVRGLTGEEIARSNEASQRSVSIAAAVEALASTAAAKPDQVEALQTLLGYGTETPADLAKRFDHLVFGSIDPSIDREIAVRLFQSYPVAAYHLTNKILELTGMGPDLGKAPRSTPIPESAPA
jgi:hypothetical protein